MPTTSKMPAKADEKLPSSPATKLSSIKRDMCVLDILTLLPDAAPLLAQYGLSCFSCAANVHETLEMGCRGHGMPEAEIDDLVKDLNEMMKNRPARPEILTLTESAAMQLKEMMQAEGKSGWGLLVGLDDGGGFCMEFRKDADNDHRIFFNEAVSDVKLFATSLTLGSIGGATIDLRDGRFKLDLPEDAAKKMCGCGGAGNCECGGECGCTDH